MRVEISQLDKTFVKQHGCKFVEGGGSGRGTGEVGMLSVNEKGTDKKMETEIRQRGGGINSFFIFPYTSATFHHYPQKWPEHTWYW